MDPAPDPAPLEQDPEEFIRQERCVSATSPRILFAYFPIGALLYLQAADPRVLLVRDITFAGGGGGRGAARAGLRRLHASAVVADVRHGPQAPRRRRHALNHAPPPSPYYDARTDTGVAYIGDSSAAGGAGRVLPPPSPGLAGNAPSPSVRGLSQGQLRRNHGVSPAGTGYAGATGGAQTRLDGQRAQEDCEAMRGPHARAGGRWTRRETAAGPLDAACCRAKHKRGHPPLVRQGPCVCGARDTLSCQAQEAREQHARRAG